jgi:hypothetical protein
MSVTRWILRQCATQGACNVTALPYASTMYKTRCAPQDVSMLEGRKEATNPDAVGISTRIGNCFHRASCWLQVPVSWVLSARCVRQNTHSFRSITICGSFHPPQLIRSTQLTWVANPTPCCIYSIGEPQREREQGGPGPIIGSTHKVGNVMRVHSVRSLET